jgi:hypothetical protein
MKLLDLEDMVVHGVVAIVTTPVLMYLGSTPREAVAMQGAFWLCREMAQHWPSPQQAFSHPQSLFEWVVPLVCAMAIATALGG